MKFKKYSLPFLGFLQATGLLLYIALIATFMTNINKILGSGPDGGFFEPIAFLLLFIVSATISGSLVLGKAGYLFWEKRYKESFTLLSWTLLWAIFYLVIVFIILFVSK